MSQPPEVVFSVTGLSKDYPLGDLVVRALRGVDLEIRAGEFVVILGPSGSGKSTLLNLLGGLDVPTAGTIRHRDQDLTTATPRQLTWYRRRWVGFVFQFYNLIPSLTAGENVSLVTELSPDSMSAVEALRLVDLADRIDSFPSQLSGGQQQRVAIARAIAKRPEVLLCDEPTGALDVGTGIGVLGAIEGVNRQFGTTTVVITHNVAIGGLADRVLTMRDGRIVEDVRPPRRLSVRELTW
ncbi:MAG: ABC transporter ATP-binding protein [Planctomycetaceae bacterium]|nr:MAG: ABC transporter ATP-binding protein [Planctomycetaceae bacterium]